ncbi:MAG: hypothetical protein ACI845_003769, partial [Gammaproteobacteria bacterium]
AVQFEITEQTRELILKTITHAGLKVDDYLIQSRFKIISPYSTRQCARIKGNWVKKTGLDP